MPLHHSFPAQGQGFSKINNMDIQYLLDNGWYYGMRTNGKINKNWLSYDMKESDMFIHLKAQEAAELTLQGLLEFIDSNCAGEIAERVAEVVAGEDW